jgi:hypothetical protein
MGGAKAKRNPELSALREIGNSGIDGLLRLACERASENDSECQDPEEAFGCHLVHPFLQLAGLYRIVGPDAWAVLRLFPLVARSRLWLLEPLTAAFRLTADVEQGLPVLTRNGHRDAFRRSGFAEYWPRPRRSLRLDVGRPDHLAPLLGVFCDELAEVGRRARQRRAAEVDQARLQLRIVESSVDLSIQPVDDRNRRLLGRTQAE